jgi:hypothetical protein
MPIRSTMTIAVVLWCWIVGEKKNYLWRENPEIWREKVAGTSRKISEEDGRCRQQEVAGKFWRESLQRGKIWREIHRSANLTDEEYDMRFRYDDQ